jgi:hypothetical protein
VALQDFLGVLDAAHAVPYRFRVDHDTGSKLASVQTACDVSANMAAQTQAFDFLFEKFSNGFRSLFAAASFGVSFGPAIGANEVMVLIGRHS